MVEDEHRAERERLRRVFLHERGIGADQAGEVGGVQRYRELERCVLREPTSTFGTGYDDHDTSDRARQARSSKGRSGSADRPRTGRKRAWPAKLR